MHGVEDRGHAAFVQCLSGGKQDRGTLDVKVLHGGADERHARRAQFAGNEKQFDADAERHMECLTQKLGLCPPFQVVRILDDGGDKVGVGKTAHLSPRLFHGGILPGDVGGGDGKVDVLGYRPEHNSIRSQDGHDVIPEPLAQLGGDGDAAAGVDGERFGHRDGMDVGKI